MVIFSAGSEESKTLQADLELISILGHKHKVLLVLGANFG